MQSPDFHGGVLHVRLGHSSATEVLLLEAPANGAEVRHKSLYGLSFCKASPVGSADLPLCALDSQNKFVDQDVTSDVYKMHSTLAVWWFWQPLSHYILLSLGLVLPLDLHCPSSHITLHPSNRQVRVSTYLNL